MEAAGELIGERDGEGCLKGRGRNLPIALCVYRCLHVLDLELPSVVWWSGWNVKSYCEYI